MKVLDDEELEMIHSYYKEHNKSNSDNMEENEENVKSLKVICKEKLESMSRGNRVYVKHVMPIENTISYTEYKGKTYGQKRKFLEENSRQVLAHYQKQFETTKKLKQNANQAEINQHDNDTLSYDMWKSSVRRSFKPKKVQNTFKIPQIDSAKIAEIDKMPEHKAVLL